MTIYSLYIYDRHCECVYYQDWHRTKRPKQAIEGNIFPGVSRAVAPYTSDMNMVAQSPRNTLLSNTGVIIAVNEEPPPSSSLHNAPAPPPQSSTGLPFDEEAKLVYGVILSLRNMIRKLSGKDEQFVNYRTSAYKLHVYETASGYKFVMLGDPNGDSLRFLLRQIYIGPFLEYVVRNPLATMDSRERGIDNEYFRASIDRLVRGLSVFP
ncbi:hypothetical protein PILCRDRAFT_672837 [Piloderma croceum F 1598]|uniref:Trafficking protein particle complex subunit n=1 Tax=Piloderma croceum (strain F 1598) TaxID=765440 RepID=A0A0C3ANK2_PILCF|nr:hypothetical protein PILCRDRAFT_672837 [Piloderma croceum F 1598]